MLYSTHLAQGAKQVSTRNFVYTCCPFAGRRLGSLKLQGRLASMTVSWVNRYSIASRHVGKTCAQVCKANLLVLPANYSSRQDRVAYWCQEVLPVAGVRVTLQRSDSQLKAVLSVNQTVLARIK